MKQNLPCPRMMQRACSGAFAILCGCGSIADAAEPQSADAATVAVDALAQSASDTRRSMPEYLRAGPFQFRPYFTGSMLYDDNIRIQSDRPIRDLVWTISPGLLIGGGDYENVRGTFVTLDYRPDIVLYTDHDEFNSVDHWVNFNGQKTWEKLSVGLGQAFQSGAGGYTEALNRVERSVYVTTLRTMYAYSDKTSFELNGLQNVSDYQQDVNNVSYSSYNQWEGQGWVNYQATAKINAGLGGTFGWRDVQFSENQTYQQALLRGIYSPTEKTRVNASVGMEFQQFQDGGDHGPDLIFDVAGTYQPWNRTTFTLAAYRRNQNSVVRRGENYTTTGFRAVARQHVGRRVIVSLTGGYEESDYYAVGQATASGRLDKYFYIGPAVDYTITDRWFLGVFYRYRDNDSTEASYVFGNNQVGVRTVFRF